MTADQVQGVVARIQIAIRCIHNLPAAVVFIINAGHRLLLTAEWRGVEEIDDIMFMAAC